MSTTYLITGANRGIGKGLVETYLNQPNNVVVAAVRDPSHSTSKALQDLPKASGSSLIIVKIDSLSESDAGNAVAELSSKHNITALDVVIANAGIAKVYPRVDEAKVSDILEHYQVNVVGTILLFQAVLPLLKRSSTTPKFIVIGSSAGTIGDMDSIPFPNAAYGPSKAALSWVAKKMARENADMVIFPVHPGFVQTDMGNFGARSFGLEKAFQTVEESVDGLVKLIKESTPEKSSGNFVNYDGSSLVW